MQAAANGPHTPDAKHREHQGCIQQRDEIDGKPRVLRHEEQPAAQPFKARLEITVDEIVTRQSQLELVDVRRSVCADVTPQPNTEHERNRQEYELSEWQAALLMPLAVSQRECDQRKRNDVDQRVHYRLSHAGSNRNSSTLLRAACTVSSSPPTWYRTSSALPSPHAHQSADLAQRPSNFSRAPTPGSATSAGHAPPRQPAQRCSCGFRANSPDA